MKHFILLLLLLSSALVKAELAVIVNKNNSDNLTSKQVQDLFLGRTRTFPNGNIALPIDQALLRADFYQQLTQKPIEQINAYWARILFTGQASPPQQLNDDQAALQTVQENKAAISYIEKAHVNANVRVLLILK